MKGDSLEIADLALDVWRIRARADADAASERVIVACERAQDRLRRLGYEVKELGGAFHPNQRARVVEHEDADGPLEVAICLTPAVYYQGKLIREAEIATRGGRNNG